MQYLQEEYEKNPDALPMPKEQCEQLLADNQELLERMQMQKQQEGEQEGIDSSEIIVENNEAAMIIEDEQTPDQYGAEQELGGIEGGE